METQNLIKEFVGQSGASEEDALRCLKTWGFDLKKALIDYNDTLTTEYFRDLNNERVSASSCNSRKYNPMLDEKQTSTTASSIAMPQHNQQTYTMGDIPLCEYKKLSRGISTAMDNVNIVSTARNEIAMDFDYEKLRDNLKLADTHDYTFTLPDLSTYSDEFRQFLDADLIDISAMRSLEESKRLNWWVDTGLSRKLWPLSTIGDGNCLLHAASLAMWGFHDRKLTLRSALHEVLTQGEFRDALWRRWRFQQTKLNKRAGFVYSEIEWCKEWEEIVNISSTAPRQSFQGNARRRSAILERNISIDGTEIYESLEEIHVLALAHVLKRAIIVISDTVLRDMNGEAMSPICFGGIYLPFEVDPNECYKGPLLLTYNNAHFSALVSMDTNQPFPPALIPLIDLNNELLPLQFCIDPGKTFAWMNYDGGDENWSLTDQEQVTLLKEYLVITYTCLSENLDYEIFENLTDEEFEKGLHTADVMLSSSNTAASTANGHENPQNQNKSSKAAKQLQSIAKQFGSIGKSVSKKIKKNIDSIARKGSKKGLNQSESFNSQTRIPCAELKSKRHGYHDQMIENYLICAQIRFVESENGRGKAIERKSSTSSQIPMSSSTTRRKSREDEDNIVNNEIVATGYHYERDPKISPPPINLCYDFRTTNNHQVGDAYRHVDDLMPKYGTGRSKFYMQADLETHNMVKDLPYAKNLNELDQTIYLTNSTFFNDKLLNNENFNNYDDSNYTHNFPHYPPTINKNYDQYNQNENDDDHKIKSTKLKSAPIIRSVTELTKSNTSLSGCGNSRYGGGSGSSGTTYHRDYPS